MPAAYAHMTVVNALSVPKRLDAISGFPREAIQAVMQFLKYCELGAVSPDYPYLALAIGKGPGQWADLMHYVETVSMMRAGIRRVQPLQGEARLKAFAWLLGYSAHVAADVAVHPVVMLRVGEYDENKTAHRMCEMNQDVYIFAKRMRLQVDLAEHLASGIGACGSPDDPDRLDPVIETLWAGMLEEVYRPVYQRNPPQFSQWRQGFDFMVNKCAEEGNRLIPFARHVAADCGLVYPAQDDLDESYLKNLPVPGGGHLDYDVVFERALDSASTVWKMVATAVAQGEMGPLASVDCWDLDTGCDKNNNLIFWS